MHLKTLLGLCYYNFVSRDLSQIRFQNLPFIAVTVANYLNLLIWVDIQIACSLSRLCWFRSKFSWLSTMQCNHKATDEMDTISFLTCNFIILRITWLSPHQAKCCHNKKNEYDSSSSHDHRAIFQKSPKFAMLVYWNVTTQTLDMWSGRTVS